MKNLHGKDFGYPLLDLAEAYAYHTAFPVVWERHASWEIHHVLSGSVVYEFDRGVNRELRGGTFLAIPPRTRHRTMNGSASPSTRLAMRWAPQKPGLRRGQSPLFLAKKDIILIFSDLAANGLRVRSMSRDMLRSAKEIFSAINCAERRPTGLAAARFRHYCNGMLLTLALAAKSPEPLAKDENVVTAMQGYIDKHLDEKLRMMDLRQVSGYGTTQLCRLFQEKLGLSPTGYLVRARLRRAIKLLDEGKLSLTEIALSCGFPSASYFSTVFHKYQGVTPGKFKDKP